MPWTRKSTGPIFLASSSKTAMNSLPMILRLRSGSVTPSSAFKKRAPASTIADFRLEASFENAFRRVLFRLCAAGRCRRKYRSAACRSPYRPSVAATEESTPPDIAQMTWPLPTCSRMALTCVWTNDSIVQVGFSLQTLCRKFLRILAPDGRVMHFRMELHAVELGVEVGDGGKAAHCGCAPDAQNPSAFRPPRRRGSSRPAVLASRPPKDPVGMIDFDLGVAVFAVLGFLHSSAEMLGHQLHAVADAEDRNAQLPDAGSGRGASAA